MKTKANIPLVLVLFVFLLSGCMSDSERASREDEAWKSYIDVAGSLAPFPQCRDLPAAEEQLRRRDSIGYVRITSECNSRESAKVRAAYENIMLDLASSRADRRAREDCLGIPGKQWEAMSPTDLRRCISLSVEGKRGLREDEAWRNYKNKLFMDMGPFECRISEHDPKNIHRPERVDRFFNRIDVDCEARVHAKADEDYRRAMIELAPDLAARRAREFCFDNRRKGQTSPAELHRCVSQIDNQTRR